jgi:SAM-dependent MidA family methyltransferase
VDLRRIPPRQLDGSSDPVLLAAIQEEIRRDGPMTFARFMEIALYDPARGYYRSPEARPGRAGDFLTAPEAHPIFGRAIARFAAAVHDALGSPEPLTIRELGAGEGALAEPLVAGLAPCPVEYLVDEIEPARIEAVRRRLSGHGADVRADDGRPIDGLVLANEVLDALPTHRVVQRGDRVREIRVGLSVDDEFVDVEDRPTSPGLADRLRDEAIALADGQVAEICLELDGWVARVASGLRRGVWLVIDYGHPAAELYGPRRRAGTLATYHGHQVGEEPYRAIGRQDITAHVDVTAVERAAAAAGLDLLGHTTQAAFLDGLGIGGLLVAEQTAPGATLPAYLEARSAVVRMIDPAAMGAFRVLAFGRGLPPGTTLGGLSSRGLQLAGGDAPRDAE